MSKKKEKDIVLSVPLDFKPMKGFGGGMRQEWITAEGDDLTAGLDSGAGLGNPLLTFWIEPKVGERRYYTVSVQDLLTALIEKAKLEMKA